MIETTRHAIYRQLIGRIIGIALQSKRLVEFSMTLNYLGVD
jgi:hypothetical protein